MVYVVVVAIATTVYVGSLSPWRSDGPEPAWPSAPAPALREVEMLTRVPVPAGRVSGAVLAACAEVLRVFLRI